MDPVTDSGGRVTRALRKRLTSIDSDNSSRPGTPIQSKLAATTNSPLKPRMTRRNSTSGGGTPVKTPAKRGGNAVATIVEAAEENVMPAKRATRRRSVSQIENEATSKLDSKTQNFEPLAEEEVSIRVTRSQSKSPLCQAGANIIAEGKTKTTGRQRRSVRKGVGDLSQSITENENNASDVEERLSNASPHNRKPLINETNVKKEAPDSEEEENKSSPRSKSPFDNVNVNVTENISPEKNGSAEGSVALRQREDFDVEGENIVSETDDTHDGQVAHTLRENAGVEEVMKVSENQEGSVITQSPLKSESGTSPKKNVNKSLSNHLAVDDIGKDLAEETFKLGKDKTDNLDYSAEELFLKVDTNENLDDSVKKDDHAAAPVLVITSAERQSHDPEHVIELPKEGDVGMLDIEVAAKSNQQIADFKSTPPSKKGKSSPFENKYQSTNISFSAPNVGTVTPSQKSVAFSNLSEDECEKSIYPKTPASSKNKSFVEMNKEHFKDSPFQDNCNDSVITVHDTTDVESPQKQQMEITSSKYSNITPAASVTFEKEQQGGKIRSESPKKSDDNGLSATKSTGTELKWCNPSVESSKTKLDTILKEVDLVEKPPPENKVEKQKKDKVSFLKRNEWNDDEDDSRYEEEDSEVGEEEEEKPYARKHSFHDDEAMVVDDYESGDSMDSEERREIMENEIPIDGESIGSNTTEDSERTDEENTENDSFIVSDNCNEEDHQYSSCSDGEYDDGEGEHNDAGNRENKKRYKLTKRIVDSSSSDEEEQSKETNVEERKSLQKDSKSSGTTSLNSSKLSNSAQRSQSEPEDEPDDSNAEVEVSLSRQEILRKLNHSDRFNNSVRDIQSYVDETTDALANSNSAVQQNFSKPIDITDKLIASESSLIPAIANKEEVPGNGDGENDDDRLDDQESPSTSSNDSDSDQLKFSDKTSSSSKHSESHLGEVSVTSEEKEDNLKGGSNDESDESGEDNYKENEVAEQKPKAAGRGGLSASFSHFPQQRKEASLQRKLVQRSFTIGLSVNGDEIETAVLKNNVDKSKELASSSPSASLSSNEETDGKVLSSDDARYLENIKHIPLGNPLVRTRRQSLALPTNPNMEICSTQQGVGVSNYKRKSLAILSENDFHPSQSFICSLEHRKAEIEQQSAKRKRLSKSFCGTADNSAIDVDIRHLHKRSKLTSEHSFADSSENIRSNNSTKVTHSSTPYEKDAKRLNNSGVRHILNRCDEILEAANRAKLEAKINYKKSKIKLPKKNKKRIQQKSLAPETDRDKKFAPSNKDIKQRDDAKFAVKKALKASADIIIGKHRKLNIEEKNELPSQILTPDQTEDESVPNEHNIKSHPVEKNLKLRNYTTAAGNVVEMLQSPKKKKKPKFIHLSTGKVCVEPITPSKSTTLTCSGLEFRESPVTPCAVGFKVREILPSNTDTAPHLSQISKRKRNSEERKRTFCTPHWTQSGLFIEEELPFAGTSFHHRACTSKRAESGHQSKNLNFKQSALFRSDIKRATNRDILQLRERRRVYEQY